MDKSNKTRLLSQLLRELDVKNALVFTRTKHGANKVAGDLKKAGISAAAIGEHFTWHSWHCSGIDRKVITKGMGFFSPMRYSELPRFYRENLSPVDVVMLQTTPMDAHGNFNFGLAASHLADIMARAKCIIVEVNQNMPWVYGLTGTEINIQDVTYVVEGDNPPVAQLGGGGEPTDVDRAVANLVVPEIPNGACLQLGIGGMPNTIGAMIAQSDLKDLCVHTEMYVDGFVDMAAAGKITGRHKALDRGRQVFAFAAGTQKLYDYVNRNPDVMAAPVDYTNDVRVIAQMDNFISINNAIDMDPSSSDPACRGQLQCTGFSGGCQPPSRAFSARF